MKKLIYRENHDWHGKLHKLELYESSSVGDISPITQVQAVCFIDKKNIVLYKSKSGWYGMPGGKPEKNESYKTALAREIKEESACQLLECGLIGYIKDTEVASGNIKYQLRYWAKVALLDEAVNDPCNDAIAREVVGVKEAANLLKWGPKTDLLIKLASEKLLIV